MQTRYLSLSWSVSRGRDTAGYNICRLDDGNKRYRCSGGGYDMTGTVFGEWLMATYPDRLLTLKKRAGAVWDNGKYVAATEGRRMARTGLEVTEDYSRGRNGKRVGFIVTDTRAS